MTRTAKLPSFLPTSAEMVDNIVSIFNKATKDEVDAGMYWYLRAHYFCTSIAAEFNLLGLENLTAAHCAYALSALSPRNSWTNNQSDLRWVLHSLLPLEKQLQADVDLFAHYRGFAFLPNIEKARKILTSPANVDLETLLDLVGKGNKTRNFALLCNLQTLVRNRDGLLSCPICVDTHAISIALGRRALAGETTKVFASDIVYRLIAEAYAEASERLWLDGYKVQAITWVTWKRLNNI
jgi:hypothetical protein